ncbi:MAG: hypothetical protein U0269_12905 [Polyangiales bacterium]
MNSSRLFALRPLKRAPGGVLFALFAALAVTARASDAEAQPWRFDGVLSGETNDALTVDGLALASGPSSQATGNFQLSIPPGSTIVSAALYTVLRFRRDLLPASIPGNLRLGGVSILNDGGPTLGSSSVGAAARCFDANLCMYTHRFDVTSVVSSVYGTSVALPMLTVALQETGDSGTTATGAGEAFSFAGHTLVVRYQNSRILARKRFLGVWYGAADQLAEMLLVAGNAPPEQALCPAGGATVAARAEGVTFSASIAGLENGCGENNLLLFQRGAGPLFTFNGVGGADDGPLGMPPDCASPMRPVDFRALYTAGSFGGATGAGTSASDVLTGAPIELDGDFLLREPSPPRMSDELYSLMVVPSSVQFVRNAAMGPPKVLSVAVLQYPPARADSDGDGHTDLAEGICARVDTDRDSNQREDWDDTDSDNDCIRDALESAADRVVRAPIALSDQACASGSPSTPFCQLSSGGCQSCAIPCATNTNGRVCTRLGSGELGCGCVSDVDCPMGLSCDPNSAVCARRQADAGADVVTDARADAASDSAIGDGAVSMEAGVDASDRDGGASGDAAVMDDGAVIADGTSASDAAIVGPSPGVTGGACDCRAGVGHARAGRGAWGALALMAAAAVAERRRRRSQG